MYGRSGRSLIKVGCRLALATGLFLTLCGCGGNFSNETYSCTDAGFRDLHALGTELRSAFPAVNRGTTVVDDCDSSGKSSIKLVVPGQLSTVESNLPTSWRCDRGRGDDLDTFWRCTLKGQPAEVILEFRSDSEVSVYARPLA